MGAVGMGNHHDRRPLELRGGASTFGGAAAAAACNLSPNYFAGKSYFAAGFRNSGEDIARKSGNFKWVGVALLPCTSRIS